MLRTYPDVDDEFVRLVAPRARSPRAGAERLRHEPRHGAAQGPRHDARRGVRVPRRPAAHRATGSASTAWSSASAGKELLRRLLPLAEKYDQKLGYELHAPMGPERPEAPRHPRDVRRARVGPARLHRRLQLHDAQPFPDAVPHVVPDGPAEEHFAVMQDIWRKPVPMHERNDEFEDYLRSHDFDPARLGPFTRLAFNMHGLVPTGGMAGHHAAHLPRAREVLRHRRERRRARDGRAADHPAVRAGRLHRLPLQRVGGPRVRRPRRGRSDRLVKPSTADPPGDRKAAAAPVPHHRPEEAPWPRTTRCSATPTSTGTPTG